MIKQTDLGHFLRGLVIILGLIVGTLIVAPFVLLGIPFFVIYCIGRLSAESLEGK